MKILTVRRRPEQAYSRMGKRWYVIQTQKGQEWKILTGIRERVTEEDEEVFILENEKMYKHQGEWTRERENLFPGYFFIITDRPVEFNSRMLEELKHMKWLNGKNMILKLVKVDSAITPIHPEEEEFLSKLGGEEHLVRYSEGFKDGDRIIVESGSLKGLEGRIRKIDRHNRQAIITMSLLGRETDVTLGLGIVRSI